MKKNILKSLREDYGHSGNGKLQPIPQPTFNKTFTLENTFFIKLTKIGELHTPELYAARLEAVCQMGKAGVSVPNIIETEEGKTYVEIHDDYTETDYFMEVHSFIPDAEHFGFHPGQLKQVAANMADYHNVLDKLEGKNFALLHLQESLHSKKIKESGIPFDEELDMYLTKLDKVPQPLRKHLESAVLVIKERYKEILEKAYVGGLDKGLIHGDLHNEQMLFNKTTKKLEALIDWEGMHNGARAFDMGYTAERLTTNLKDLYDLSVPLSSLSHDAKAINSFIKKYSEHRKIPSRDIDAIVDQLLIECVNRDAGFLRIIFGQIETGAIEHDFDTLHLWLRIQSIERLEELRKALA